MSGLLFRDNFQYSLQKLAREPLKIVQNGYHIGNVCLINYTKIRHLFKMYYGRCMGRHDAISLSSLSYWLCETNCPLIKMFPRTLRLKIKPQKYAECALSAIQGTDSLICAALFCRNTSSSHFLYTTPSHSFHSID